MSRMSMFGAYNNDSKYNNERLAPSISTSTFQKRYLFYANAFKYQDRLQVSKRPTVGYYHAIILLQI